MKKGFTLVEVSILLVIFLIVAFLVAPLSLDDTLQAHHTSIWRSVQSEFSNLFYSFESQDDLSPEKFAENMNDLLENQYLKNQKKYRIIYLNGIQPKGIYSFENYKNTYSMATISSKVLSAPNDDGPKAVIMYDVNGQKSPNIWGKDVFGFNVYNDRIEPFCKHKSIAEQKSDCSKSGTGLCCSNYYLIGGSFD